MRSGDRFVLRFVVVLAVVSMVGWVALSRQSGDLRAQVSQNGREVFSVNVATLKVPFERRFSGPWGYNVVRFQIGGAAIVASDCPDDLCVRAGLLTRAGQSAVCLPHRLTLTLVGPGEKEQLDGMAR